MQNPTNAHGSWPRLRLADWSDTRDTFHMWTQVVGKIRMSCAPMLNHWWQVPLYVDARGLSTSPIPYAGELFEIAFDLLDHRLRVQRSDGRSGGFALAPMSVAEFYARTLSTLSSLGIEVEIRAVPNEVDPAIPFADDAVHASYDGEAIRLFWGQLIQANRLLTTFRSHFIGKASPVHFFWGSMDLACTRFSGRRAPAHPGGAPHCADWVMLEAYSHELSSAGFWPGGGEEGAFYSYAYPQPEGFERYPVESPGFYSTELGEFLLPYEKVRTAADPDRVVLDFLQSTFEAASELARWSDVSRAAERS
jgi:Family of unknown function (DUF5996)